MSCRTLRFCLVSRLSSLLFIASRGGIAGSFWQK